MKRAGAFVVAWACVGCNGGQVATGDEVRKAATDAMGSGPPSCIAVGDGLTNCGADNESCCTSPAVAADAKETVN